MNNTKFVKIKSISKSQPQDIYHLTVKNNHNFFGNNLCLHNCGYTGELGVKVYNVGHVDVVIEAGERYAQIAVLPIPEYEMIELNDEEFEELKLSQSRGDGGIAQTAAL